MTERSMPDDPMLPLSATLDALKFHIATDEEIDRLELETRVTAAREIRDRLPPYLRASIKDLHQRIVAAGSGSDARTALLLDASRWQVGMGSVVMLGKTSLGKSTAAAIVFLRQLVRGVREGGSDWEYARRLAWFHASALTRARLEHPLGMGEAPEIREAVAASLCVLDDLGWDRDPEPCSIVIKGRYENGLPTIVTTGLTRAAFMGDYSEAVVRRLLDAGGLHPLVVELVEPEST